MGSGESDARIISIDTTNTTSPVNNWNYWYYTVPSTTNWYPNTIYMYQIQCPKKTCRKFNWAQLDIVIDCVGCKSKLKAISEKVDYEVPVNK